MERFDVLVVGAGPAGSTTAYRLSRAGARVLLVDRARFPRDKPCGGGLTMRAVRLLPFSVEPVVEDRSSDFTFGLDFKHHFERQAKAPLVLLTQRSRLDQFLAEQAAEAGADFRDAVKLTDLDVTDHKVEATVGGSRVLAQALIAADGANGTTARAAGIDDDRDYGVALEGNVPNEALDVDRFRGRLFLELGVVPGGYGWVFPKGDHINVGVGGWAREAPTLRGHLTRFCREYELDEGRLESVRGFRLPLIKPVTELARGRVALVGDAAGLVDPLSGDGIYEAFLSGRLVSEATLDLLAGNATGYEPYAHVVRRSLASQLAAAWGAKMALDRFPRLTYAAIRSPYVWKAVESLMGGEVPSPGAMRGIRRASLKVIAAIARASGNPGKAFAQT
jgi:geranylgeranyl reductase family protein